MGTLFDKGFLESKASEKNNILFLKIEGIETFNIFFPFRTQSKNTVHSWWFSP